MSAADLVGVLPLLKPVGPTSHDIVARVRRWLPGVSVGHLGTLDPAAAGLLLVAVGGATKAARFLEPPDTPKTYRAWAVFGAESDSDDGEGRMVAHRGAAGLGLGALGAAVRARTGHQPQVPPARSAVRVGGRHAYERARAGESVALAPRDVMVEDGRVLSLRPVPGTDDMEALLECTLWRGGYVRSWVRDIGQDLGCGGYVRVLVRGRVGIVHDGDALTLAEGEAEAAAGTLRTRLWPVDRWLGHWPLIEMPADPGGRVLGRGLPAPSPVQGWVRVGVRADAPAWALAQADRGRWVDVVRLGRAAEVGR